MSSRYPPWFAALVATLAAVAADVWGSAAGVDVQTAATAGAALIVTVVAREHMRGTTTTAATTAATAPANGPQAILPTEP